MQEIRPIIHTLAATLAHIGSFGRPVFLKYDNGHSAAYVLTGGSIKHRVAVSLILSSHQGYIMGKYKHWEQKRLVIKDGRYRTRYAIDSVEYADIRERMEGFGREKDLSLINHTDHNG